MDGLSGGAGQATLRGDYCFHRVVVPRLNGSYLLSWVSALETGPGLGAEIRLGVHQAEVRRIDGSVYPSERFLLGEFMPGEGVEPSRPEGPGILSPLRLPFRHPGDVRLIRYYGLYVQRGAAAAQKNTGPQKARAREHTTIS